MSEQITFATSDFASNPEPRCPCILLLDVSGSMNGRPINELNAGLVTFRDELLADPLALKRVELGIVTFGPVHVEQPFTSAANFFPPILFAQGDTPMGAAITKALDMVEERKREYRANGISYYRPWIFLITDGAPTDEWQAAANKVFRGEEDKRFAFFSIGVQGADMKTLAQISVRQPLPLQGLQFVNCLAGYPVRCVRFPAPRRERKLCWKRQKAGRQCELASGLCINRWNVAHQRGLALSGCLPDADCLVK